MKWDSILTATLVGCALLTTGLLVRREFFAPQDRSPVASPPRFISDWQSNLGTGVLMGSHTAPVQIMEFGDFECPFCATFAATLRTIRERYPDKVAVDFFEFPIRGHRFALPAARVAECAGAQGRFEAMYEALYEDQESLGLKPWSQYATQAGISDIPRFKKCSAETGPLERVGRGQTLGNAWGVRGTPTVVVNGWMFAEPPTLEKMDAAVKRIMNGKSPVESVSTK